ncbi:HNH endonuclease domain protein [Bifidobacterium pullorum subsp. gallinarum]|uniref:HNH endonuclease domain protein n=1 Tax=Bifidobacterium pullorum subsp. gallinarum TaxID=78344 RepID=A0A087APL5_9BIFI|nr:hypothetical protein [Bifidobacterium pullorum]KFI60715.1 HNH endonuclease domain protein [Bifidobacterium pullorum subsp. gallinarum]
MSLESVEEDPGCMAAVEFVTSLSDDELATLDSISLPSGRAAYSAHTLDILTHLMLTTDDDLHEARKHAFNVPDDWRPAEPPVGEPVGNPAVDRVLKIVNRYLLACER